MPEEAYEPPFNPSDSYSDTSTTTTHPPLHHNRRQATTRKRRSFCFCDDPDCGCRADHSICCHNDNTYSTLFLHPPLPVALFTDTDIRIMCLPTYMNTILTLTDLWQHDNDNDYHTASSTTKTGQTATTTCSTAAAAAVTTTLPRTQSWWTTSSFRVHLPPQLMGSADGSVGSIKGESAHEDPSKVYVCHPAHPDTATKVPCWRSSTPPRPRRRPAEESESQAHARRHQHTSDTLVDSQ